MLEVGDGIARVYGLSGVMAGEMVEFRERRPRAGVQPRRELGRRHHPRRLPRDRRRRRRSRRPASCSACPVGDALIGRVVDPLGNPLDGKGPIVTDAQPAGRVDRPRHRRPAAGDEPLQTGIKAIDAMTPIGRGQRELIIGDRKTGKTAIAIDTIINQKGDGRHLRVRRDRPEGVDGRRASSRASASTARWTTPSSSRAGAATRPRCSTSPRTPAARWPSTSCTSRAGDTLCVYDDLSKQAAAYRATVAAAAPPAGPRGVSRRHVLLPTRGCSNARPSWPSAR